MRFDVTVILWDDRVPDLVQNSKTFSDVENYRTVVKDTIFAMTEAGYTAKKMMGVNPSGAIIVSAYEFHKPGAHPSTLSVQLVED